jgi:hypothetical protein
MLGEIEPARLLARLTITTVASMNAKETYHEHNFAHASVRKHGFDDPFQFGRVGRSYAGRGGRHL